MNRTENISEFTLKYNGELNQIEVNTLIHSLTSLTSLIDEINEEISGGKGLKISIKSPEKGSFLIGFLLSQEFGETIKTIFNKDTIDVTSKILSSLISILNLRKILKGQKPKEVHEKEEKYEIKTEKGNVVVLDKPTFNLYFNNPKVSDAVGSTFDTLSNDPSVSSFEILDPERRPLFEAKRDEFNDMAIKLDLIDEKKRIINQRAHLFIYKVIFDDKHKWDFYYKGNRITAKISDVDFFSKIETGEKFAKGDSLEVDLQVEQAFDTTANTFINKSYRIERVIRHIPRGQQESIEFDK